MARRTRPGESLDRLAEFDHRSGAPGVLRRSDLPFDGKPTSAGSDAHYADPQYYDKAYARRTGDTAYYAALARGTGGPVLEYGVGNGRVALAIASQGIEVVGVDTSAAMLTDLRAKLSAASGAASFGKVTLIEGDMRSLRLKQRFPLVIAPFNTVLHLYTRPEVEAFLEGVKSHLGPGGRFVFDFSLPKAPDLARDPDRYFGAPRLKYPGKGVVRYAEQFHYDPLEQTLRVNMRFTPDSKGGDPGGAWEVPLCHRQFFPREMEALLHYNGFSEQIWSADFEGDLPHADADSLVVSCRDPGR